MRIDTTSGLHGTLIEYRVTEETESVAVALVRRDCPGIKSAPYSTHRIYNLPDGSQVAEAGHYDLTLDQAQQDLDKRAPRKA